MKNLLGRLMSRPFDELKAISNAWGALTRDPNPSQNDLAIAVYHAMVEPSAARGVWEVMDPEMRSFVVWLLGQRNMLALAEDLPAHLNRPVEEVAPLLERTRLIGILDVDEALVRGTRVVSSGDNLYAWGARNQPEAVRKRVVSISAEAGKVITAIIEESKRPAPFEDSFASLLQGLEQEQVQKIAQTWKLPDATRYYKSELIGVMSEFLATGQGRQLVLAALSPASRSAFAHLEENGGRAKAIGVRRHFGWDEREFRAGIVPLVQRALVWDVLEDNTRYLFIPADLVHGRSTTERAEVSPAAAMGPKLEAPEPYAIDSKLPYELTWDLLTLLGAAADGEIALTLQDNRITKRLAKRINDSFLQPVDLKNGTDYIDMVVHLAQTLGLMEERQEEQPMLALTSRVDEWAKLSFDAQARRLFGLWQEDRKWTEPATYGTIYWWNSDLTGGRKRLIAHLSELPDGQWIQIEAFLRKIHLTEPFLIWSQDELMRRFGLRALQGFRSQWFSIEGRIIADMLKTVLYWLGAIELGRDKQKRVVSFRLTDEGRTLLDPEHVGASRRPAKTLMVQPNFEVLVLHPQSHVIWNLVRSANLVRHDRVSVYAINKESVGRAVDAGMTPDAIKDFLNANTGKGLPQNVAHSIDDWSRLVKRANIRRATLIEVEDARVLDEMMASRKTRRYVAQRLSPTVAIANLPEVSDSARDDAWQRLMKELKGAGYSPRFLGGEGEIPVADTGHANGAQQNGVGNGHIKPESATVAGPARAPASRGRAGRISRLKTSPTGNTGTS
ncbi:MAG: helicase-associated domain-containing protein [Chloroflexia bacterium]